MRYIIIFGVTIIISLFLVFYPKNYLMKFNDKITIDYANITKDEKWEYTLNNDCLELNNYSNNKWDFNVNKNGKCTLTFYFDKKDDEFKYKIIYELSVKNRTIIWKKGEALGLLDYPNPY